MDNSLVSIIIPVYNVRLYLTEAINSVINQTYHNLEIIIIDDGSTDGSEMLCEDFAKKDKRIRLIHQENKGLSAARNSGLDIMTGDIVAFLDPDDKLRPDFVSSMLSTMIQNNVDLVICKHNNIYSADNYNFPNLLDYSQIFSWSTSPSLRQLSV